MVFDFENAEEDFWTHWTPDALEKRKHMLSELVFKITQKKGTEPAFNNPYWNHEEEGIYVDCVSGEPLFASIHKYDSQSGWPSFYQTLAPDSVKVEADHSHGISRVEVRSKIADSHLGHVFPDGPLPTGLRFCINAHALHFVPKHLLKIRGYGRYSDLFDKK